MDDFFNEGPPGRYDPNQYNPEIAKNVYFIKNGVTGPHVKPLRIVLTNSKYRSFDALLDDISDKVPGMLFGVRNIYQAGTKRAITSLEDFEDGGAYTCVGKGSEPEKWAMPRNRMPSAGLKRLGQNVPPKRITVVRANNQNDRQTLLLNRKTTQSFEQVLSDVAQLFPGMYARKLYTLDGAPIASLSSLFNGPDVLMVGQMEKAAGGGRHSAAAGRPQQAARKLGVKTRSEYRSRGRWKIWVTTGDTPSAGTTSRIFLTSYGKTGVAGPLALGMGDGTAFQTGNIDEFDVNLGSLGPLYKIRISHDNSGSSPNWFCEEVRMRDIDTGEELVFPFRRWLSRTEDDLDINRELPVNSRGGLNLPLGQYTIDAYTGGVPNAGTDANVYVTIYGEHGDAGNRQLYNGRQRNFLKGQAGRFQMEAVSLGNLTHLVVGHDGRGPGRGWFLDKIVVKEQFGQFREWTFGCNRWLDEGQDDRKIIRDLYPGDNGTPATLEPATNVWDFERWKYDVRNQLIFYNAATSRAICFRPGNTLDSLGEENDRKSNRCVFEVVHLRNDYRAFANCAQRGACIGMKNGAPIVSPSAHQANLTNSPCEFKPSVLKSDRRTQFESAKNQGHHWCITPSGHPTDCRTVSGQGPLKEFYVYCKGIFRDGSVITLVAANNLILSLDKDGKQTVAVSSKAKLGQFRVVKVAEGGLRMFESGLFQNQFLQMKNGSCNCQGIGDRFSQFRINRVREKAYVLIQSVAYPGSYLALTNNGKAQQVTDPGSASIIFYPEVIRFGTPKQTRPLPQPLTPKRAPSMPPPEPVPQPKRQPVYVPPSPSPSPEAVEVPTPQPTITRHPQPDNKTRFNEGDWLVWISTHETAVNGNVGLAVYGSNGTSGTIMLGGPSRNMFKQGTKDQFLVNLKQLGELYKVRLEFYPISFATPAVWKIAEAQLHDMTTNELLRFSFNRFVSLTEDDGDLMRELPAIRPGATILTIYNYYIEVETGYVDGAQTTANVYLQIFGQRGDTGRRLLHRSVGSPMKWQPGQTDRFTLDAVDLSTLTKCLVAVDSREPGAGWFLSKLIVREWENAQTEYTFPCNRWFDVGRDDGQTERYLYPSSPAPGPRKPQTYNPPMPQPMPYQQAGTPGQPIIIFAQPPAPFPYLPPSYPYPYPQAPPPVQQQPTPPPAPPPEPPAAIPQPGEWNVWVTTGQGPLKGKAELWVYGVGRVPKVGPLTLGSGSSGNFKANNTDNFTVVISPSLGSIYKIRIGHLDSIPGDEWFVEKVIMKCLETQESLTFWIRRFMSRSQDDFDVVRESPAIRQGASVLEICKYHVAVKLGNQRGVKLDNKVHIELRGTRGDSGMRVLYHSLNNKTKFLAGQKDTFLVEAVDLDDLREILIGHTNELPGQGFFIEHVIVTVESPTKQEWFFPCDKWFDKNEDDRLIERVLRPGDPPKAAPPPEGAKDGEWVFITKTGSETAMSTNDAVSLWAYGDKGRVGPLTLARAKSNKYFRPGGVDEFNQLIPTAALGKMYKIRIGRLEETKDSWFLESVKAKNKFADYVLNFECRRWLSRTNDDFDVWREMPAVWPGKDPLPIYRYKLEVYTGKKPGAETEARVYAELRGKRGDSGTRVLFHSLNGTGKKFQLGQMDEFEIEAVDLDDLEEMLVGHDCTDKGGGWFLDRIAVFLDTAQTKDTPRKWYFPCNKWFDKGEEDGAIERILRAGAPPPKEGEWNVWTTTGHEINMETSDTVVLWAYGDGDKGKAGPIQLGAGRAGHFKASQTDEFKVIIDHKVGNLYKIRIGRLEQSQEPWFLEKVKMKDLFHEVLFNFNCKRWLSRKHEDLDVWRELPVVSPGKTPLPILIYKVEVYTGSEVGADTEAHPYCEIRGKRGDAGIRKLYKSKNHPSEMFQLKQMDMFEIEAVDLDELTEVLLGHDAQERGAGWYVDHVIIRLDKPNERGWYFPCKKWFDRGQEDGRIERILKVGDFPKEEKAPPPPPPKKEEEPPPKEEPKKEDPKPEGDWEVQITTGKAEPACGHQENKIELWAYGDKNIIGPLPLGSGKDGKYFKPGNVDTFFVKIGDDKPGKMYKIRFGTEEDENETGTWYVEKVKIKDLKTSEETLYKCGRWLSRTHEDKDVWRELPTPGPSTLSVLVYEVSIATGKLQGSDTDARCHIQLFGKRGDSGKRILYHTTNNKHKFREGQVDTFQVEAVDLDDLQKILLGHGDTASGAGWYVERVIITAKAKSGELQWYFPCAKWFDSSQDDGKIERFLYPGAPPGESKGEYKVLIKTAKESGRVPAGKTITLAIYGDQNHTHDNELVPKSSTPYHADHEDEAEVKALGLGKIYKIRIGHSNKFEPFDWHVEWVKLIDKDTNDEFLFTFDKWLSIEKAQDSHLDREAAVTNEKKKPAAATVIYYVGINIGDHWFAETEAPLWVKLSGTQGDTGKRYLFYTVAKKKAIIVRGKMLAFPVEAVDLKEVQTLTIGCECKGHGGGTFVDLIRVSSSADANNSLIFPCGRWLDPWEDDGLCERLLRCVDKIPANEALSKTDPKAPKIPSKWKVKTKSGPDTDKNYNTEAYMTIYGSRGKSKRAKLANGSRAGENFAPGAEAEFEVACSDIGHIKKVSVDTFTATGEAEPLQLDWVKMTDASGSSSFQYFFYLDRWLAPEAEDGSLCREMAVAPPTPAQTAGSSTKSVAGKASSAAPSINPTLPYLLIIETGGASKATQGIKNGTAIAEILGTEGESGERHLLRSLSSSGAGPAFGKPGTTDIFMVPTVDVGSITEVRLSLSEKGSGNWQIKRIRIRRTEHDVVETVFSDSKFVVNGSVAKFESPEQELAPTALQYERRFQPSPTPPSGTYKVTIVAANAPSGRPQSLTLTAYSATGKNSDPVDLLKLAGNLTKPQPFQASFGAIGPLMKVRLLVQNDTKFSWKIDQIFLADTKTKQELLCAPTRELECSAEAGNGVLDVGVIRPDCAPLPETNYELAIFTGDKERSEPDSACYTLITGTWGDTGRIFLTKSDKPTIFKRGQMDVCDIQIVSIGQIKTIGLGHVSYGRGLGWFVNEAQIRDTSDSKPALVFPAFRWLDTGTGDRKIYVDLAPVWDQPHVLDNPPDKFSGTFECRLFTTSEPGKARPITIILFGSSNPKAMAKHELQLNPLDANSSQGQVLSLVEPKLTDLLKMRVEDPGSPQWVVKEVFVVDKDTGEELHFNFSHLCGKPSDGCREHPAVRFKHHTTPLIDYYVKIFVADGTDASGKPVDAKITLEGSRCESGPRKVTAKKASKEGYDFVIEAVSLGSITSILVDKEANSGVPKKATVKEGKFGATAYIFHWESDPGKPEKALNYRLLFEGTGLSADTVAPKSAASDPGGSAKKGATPLSMQMDPKKADNVKDQLRDALKKNGLDANVN